MSAKSPKKMTAVQQERVSSVLTSLAGLASAGSAAGAQWFDLARPVCWVLLALAAVFLAVGLVFWGLSRRQRR